MVLRFLTEFNGGDLTISGKSKYIYVFVFFFVPQILKDKSTGHNLKLFLRGEMCQCMFYQYQTVAFLRTLSPYKKNRIYGTSSEKYIFWMYLRFERISIFHRRLFVRFPRHYNTNKNKKLIRPLTSIPPTHFVFQSNLNRRFYIEYCYFGQTDILYDSLIRIDIIRRDK